MFPPLIPAAVKQRIHYTRTEMLGEIFCCCLKGSLLKIFFKDLFVCLFVFPNYSDCPTLSVSEESEAQRGPGSHLRPHSSEWRSLEPVWGPAFLVSSR